MTGVCGEEKLEFECVMRMWWENQLHLMCFVCVVVCVVVCVCVCVCVLISTSVSWAAGTHQLLGGELMVTSFCKLPSAPWPIGAHARATLPTSTQDRVTVVTTQTPARVGTGT